MVSFHVLELLFDDTAMPRGMEVRNSLAASLWAHLGYLRGETAPH